MLRKKSQCLNNFKDNCRLKVFIHQEGLYIVTIIIKVLGAIVLKVRERELGHGE